MDSLIWWYYLMVIIFDKINYIQVVFMFIDGGSNIEE